MSRDELLAKLQILEKNESLMKKKELELKAELASFQYLEIMKDSPDVSSKCEIFLSQDLEEGIDFDANWNFEEK